MTDKMNETSFVFPKQSNVEGIDNTYLAKLSQS